MAVKPPSKAEVRRRARRRERGEARAAEVLALAAEGVPKLEIRRRLGVAVKTTQKVLSVAGEGGTPTVRRCMRVDRAEVQRLDRQGFTKSAIGRRLGIARSTVTRVLTAIPRARPDDPQNLQRQRAAAVLAFVDAGVSVTEIARRLRCATSSVYKLINIREQGGVATLRLMPPKRVATRRRRVRLAQLAELVAGKRPPGPFAIARRLGVHYNTVWADRIELLSSPLALPRQRRCADLQERDRRLREMYLSGLPAAEIAAAFRMNKTAIYKSLLPGDRSLHLREVHRLHAEIRRLVAKGLTKREIACRLKIRPSLVQSVKNAPALRLTEKVAAEARALAQQNVAAPVIMRTLKISRETLMRALDEAHPVKPAVLFRRPGKRQPESKVAQRILKLVAAGVPNPEIGRRLGVDARTVARVISLNEAGIPATVRRPGRMDRTTARRLWKRGVSKSEIARRLAISGNAVQFLLDEDEPPPIPAELAEEIRALRNAGHSKDEIGRRLHVSRRIMRCILPPTPGRGSYGRRALPAAAPRPRRRRQPQMMTLAEFAEALGVDIAVVEAAIARGEVTGVLRLGRQVLLPRCAVAQTLRAYTSARSAS
jgi:DNA-binding CsgD family transcriptional regulator/transposase